MMMALTSTQAAVISMALISMLFALGHVLAAGMDSTVLYMGLICGEILVLMETIPACVRPGDRPDMTVLTVAFIILCAAKWAWLPVRALRDRTRGRRVSA